MTDEYKKYSLVVIDKEEDLTDKVWYSLLDNGIYQTYIRDANLITTENDLLRDSILNLLYSIMHEGIHRISTGLTGNNEELIKEFENIKKMNEEKGKEALAKLDEYDKKSYQEWLLTGDWRVSDEETPSLLELLSEDIEQFFQKGKLLRIDDNEELLRIESRLLYAYGLLVGGENLEYYETIKGEGFTHEVIGYFYYFFSKGDDKIDNLQPVSFRITLANADDEFNDPAYINARVHDFESKFLPYGVITLEDFLKEIKESRDKAIKRQAQNHL